MRARRYSGRGQGHGAFKVGWPESLTRNTGPSSLVNSPPRTRVGGVLFLRASQSQAIELAVKLQDFLKSERFPDDLQIFHRGCASIPHQHPRNLATRVLHVRVF